MAWHLALAHRGPALVVNRPARCDKAAYDQAKRFPA
jgi:hypothetical protein